MRLKIVVTISVSHNLHLIFLDKALSSLQVIPISHLKLPRPLLESVWVWGREEEREMARNSYTVPEVW